MSLENQNPNLITQVPTAAELSANHVSDNAINFTDPEQLAAFNKDLVAAGLPPREAPGPRKAVELPEAPVQAYSEPFVEPENERTLGPEEMKKVREMARLILDEPPKR